MVLAAALMMVLIAGLLTAAQATVTGEGTEGSPWMVSTWAELREKLGGGGYIQCSADISAGSSDTHLLVPAGKTATLDLKGHTVDYSASAEDGIGQEGNLDIRKKKIP